MLVPQLSLASADPDVTDSNSNQPSGKDKGKIYSVLAKLIFNKDPVYGSAYTQNPKKSKDSICHHIMSLRMKYKQLKLRFNVTGAGMVPLDENSANNLQEEVLHLLPWYEQLDAIWHSNPVFATTTHSSKPGVDHAADLYALVHLVYGRAGPPAHFGGATGAQSQLSPAMLPPIIDSCLLQPATTPPCNNVPASNIHNLNHSPDADIDVDHFIPDLDDNDLYAPNPFSATLGDVMDHLDDDYMMYNDLEAWGPDMNLNSPLRLARKKCQLISLPSPPFSPPEPFIMPQKSPTPFHNTQAAFGGM
ncbi:hypothetical protein DFH29DRAFT_1036978 [Suillus ampliporus]|nr:hypothetical protein DFH29DRAFT_1036978 [Suillus ampliporus]